MHFRELGSGAVSHRIQARHALGENVAWVVQVELNDFLVKFWVDRLVRNLGINELVNEFAVERCLRSFDAERDMGVWKPLFFGTRPRLQ